MTIYELVKSLLLPGITIWESHLITISFVTILATVLAYLVIRRLNTVNDWLVGEIEKRKRAEFSSLISARRFEKAQQIAHMGSWDWDIADGSENWSDETYRIFGLDQAQVSPSFELFLSIVHPDDRENVKKTVSGLLEEQNHYDITYRIIRPTGALRIIHSQAEAVLDETKKPVQIIGTIHDITEQKRREELLAKTIQEKEWLLKEIHHRVKNNLQIISSLLSLQVMNSKDKGDIEILKESQSRIRSMALIHEKLYSSKDLSRIDLAEYTESLVSSIFHTYAISGDRIKLRLKTGAVPVDIDTAIPYGLIVNELVTNCLKYAFPGGMAGEIAVELVPGDPVTLTIRDNGVGFPEGFDIRNTRSLGMQIVFSLTEQLHGTIEFENRGGSTVEVRFPPIAR